ncbi:MAG: lipoyl synthase [Nitrospirae bacterium]|nr:lipoyl synthase [Nitrospirota bacterium]
MFGPIRTGEGNGRLPRWVTGKPAPLGAGHEVRARLRGAGLASVCEEARCPNLADCFGRGVATFMILGDTCTRRCGFCAVAHGAPAPPDADEPARLAGAALGMGLRHVVVTSVDRDDLADGGAAHFAATVAALRATLPAATVEVLTPDFGGRGESVDRVADARPAVYNHNLETVARLQSVARPDGDYRRSLAVLARVKARHPRMWVKSGLMAGLGETDAELDAAFRHLRDAGCDLLTLGQYLRPGRDQLPVARYLEPADFARLKARALEMGFAHVAAGPRVRSSFNAGPVLAALAGASNNLFGRARGMHPGAPENG